MAGHRRVSARTAVAVGDDLRPGATTALCEGHF